MVATNYVWLFRFKLIKIKYKSHFLSHISPAHATLLDSMDYKTFLSLQKVLLDCADELRVCVA